MLSALVPSRSGDATSGSHSRRTLPRAAGRYRDATGRSILRCTCARRAAGVKRPDARIELSIEAERKRVDRIRSEQRVAPNMMRSSRAPTATRSTGARRSFTALNDGAFAKAASSSSCPAVRHRRTDRRNATIGQGPAAFPYVLVARPKARTRTIVTRYDAGANRELVCGSSRSSHSKRAAVTYATVQDRRTTFARSGADAGTSAAMRELNWAIGELARALGRRRKIDDARSRCAHDDRRLLLPEQHQHVDLHQQPIIRLDRRNRKRCSRRAAIGTRPGALFRQHSHPCLRARCRCDAARRRAADRQRRAHRLDPGTRNRRQRRQGVSRRDRRRNRRRRSIFYCDEPRHRAQRSRAHDRAWVLRAGPRALPDRKVARGTARALAAKLA